MNENESFDVVVVGAGLAGLAAGATAAQGASTLILNGHHEGGRASTDERGEYRSTAGPTPCTGAARPPPSSPGSACRRPVPSRPLRGFLHVLETLNPVERVVFILADVFDVPFKEIAETVDRSPDACRQIASRARRRVHSARPHHYSPPDEEVARVVGEMLAATSAGDIDGLVRLLAEDAVLVSDGGPHKRAARHPIKGRDRIARLMGNLGRRYSHATLEPVALNGELGMVIYHEGERLAAMSFEVDNGLVCEVHVIVADDKLAALDRHLDVL